MRKILVPVLALAVAVGVPAAVMAASGGFSSALDRQQATWTTTRAVTSSRSFHPVGTLTGPNICALNQVTATLSAQLSGAPARFQVRVDGGGLMKPGSVRFVPAAGGSSFAFTFVQNVSPFENNDHHAFEVEWRSPTGKRVTLSRGTFNLQYQQGSHSC